jgi:hypothetical protein
VNKATTVFERLTLDTSGGGAYPRSRVPAARMSVSHHRAVSIPCLRGLVRRSAAAHSRDGRKSHASARWRHAILGRDITRRPFPLLRANRTRLRGMKPPRTIIQKSLASAQQMKVLLKIRKALP